jgi:uncharacterized protein (DUF1684 family)
MKLIQQTEYPFVGTEHYNSSCAYDERWVCPLAPGENRLGVRVEAGRRSIFFDGVAV